jgi:hypothetical protein
MVESGQFDMLYAHGPSLFPRGANIGGADLVDYRPSQSASQYAAR